MVVTINGEAREFETQRLTVAQLVEELGLAGRRVAVELNRHIVRRATYEDREVNDGDVVEIVGFVGGG